MFKKFMASLGIGSAKVNLVLYRSEYRIGEPVSGRFLIQAGNTDQQVDQIYVHFNMNISQNDKVQQYRIGSVTLPGMTILAGSGQTEIPFAYQIPWKIPLSRTGIQYYFSSGLDFDNAVDPSDKDFVTINPDPAMETVMRALASLGFQEKWASGSLDHHGQEFEYFPTGFMSNQIEELEIYYVHEEMGLRLYMEIDKQMRGIGGLLASKLDLNEKRTSLFFPYEDIASCSAEQVEQTAATLQKFLQQELGSLGSYRSQHAIHPHQPPYGHGYQQKGHKSSGLGDAAMGFLGGMAAGHVLGEILGGDEEGEDDGGFFGGDEGGEEW